MANFISAHTGTEIDLTIASGSTTTGVIKDFNTLSGSKTSTLSIGGNVSIGGNTTIDGNTTVKGNLTFGDANTDNISFGAEVSSSIIPDADNTYDLGSIAKSWNRLVVNQITASGNISSSGTTYTKALNVFGPAGGSGQIYVNDSDNGVGVADGLFINKSGTNAFIYNRDSGHLELGTNDIQQLHIEDSATTEGQLKIKDGGIDVTGNITASGNISASGTSHTLGVIKTTADEISIQW